MSQRKFPLVSVIYGASDYLSQKALLHITEIWQKKTKDHPSRIEGSDLNADTLTKLMGQSSLFEPQTCYVINRCQVNKSIHKMLKLIPAEQELTNPMVFLFESDKIPAYSFKEFERLRSHIVPCMEPWPNEVSEVIHNMLVKRSIKMAPDAIRLLGDAIGNDLSRIENEINKLQLIFVHHEGILTGDDIAPYVGMLRQDHAFELDRRIIAGQWSSAHALLSDLLGRGEEPLKLLGLISRHCRQAIKIMEYQQEGKPARDIGYQLRIPAQVTSNYCRYVSDKSASHFLKVLTYCQDADATLKLRRTTGDVYLGQILEMLAGIR